MINRKFFGSMLLACLVVICLSCSSNKISSGDEPKLVLLPDGSKVVLNKGSEIEYVIDEQKREVYLVGEAFFQVKKSTIPFEVHTLNGVIKVLGTKFHVHSSDDELEVEVDEGLVEVDVEGDKKKLRRGERVLYDDVKKILKKGQAEFKHHIWTDDFKNDMRQLGKEIEKGGKELGKEIKNISRDLKIKL